MCACVCARVREESKRLCVREIARERTEREREKGGGGGEREREREGGMDGKREKERASERVQ